MLSKSALVVAASMAVVEAIDNGLARTPQMGWVSCSLQHL
jgi:alpha-galactosidase